MIKNIFNITLIFVILLFAGHKGFAQVIPARGDTLQVKVQKSEASGEEVQIQNEKGSGIRQAGNAGNNNKAARAVKQVKGARPDMSRARGARPPVIVRPSGSGIPKGIGKPGGAGKRGGR